ncbi:post-GPI attachment to proteins factor 2-like isoform X2 [Orbicella faveolata]|uniref:post-GPI attachment to proteins factor 2-like isoform X2 n=1 Tax=Orbicella faveolata TaxID=48498 RepID=UPI0009E3EE66|nr:post-GPI attachment to proteins factor 2-like isoform X2 [Orbicella faveolata]
MVSSSLQAPVMSLSLDRFAVFICSLPLLSFASCVAIAIALHFEETTWSHCKVPNYLPSISAAIGGRMPERFIWRVGIALHCLPRILVMPYALHKHFKNTQAGRRYNLTTWWFAPLNLLNSLLHLVENGALLTLTYISSKENLDIHEGSFIVFMACAISFMLLHCILYRLTATQPMADEEYKLFTRKVSVMSFNCCSFGLAVYFFFRHNWYCEAGMYTLFALAEYCTIVSNVVFHWLCTRIYKGATMAILYPDDYEPKMS